MRHFLTLLDITADEARHILDRATTLKRMQKKLKAMALEHYLTQDLDKTTATITYQFPQILYPKEAFKRNMSVIRRYPASVAATSQFI